MDFGQFKTELETWLALTALDKQSPPQPLPVEFGRSPQKVRTTPFVLCYLGATASPTRRSLPVYTYDELTDENTEEMHRLLRVPVRFSFRAFSQDWGSNAREFAEIFRANTSSEPAVNALGNARIGLWGTEALVDTDYEWSGRLVSQCDTTAVFGFRYHPSNQSRDAGYIRTVNMELEQRVLDEMGGIVYDNDGNEVVTDLTRAITATTDEAP